MAALNPASLQRRCAWCGDVDVGGTFVQSGRLPVEELWRLLRPATHSICPACLSLELEKVTARGRRRGRPTPLPRRPSRSRRHGTAAVAPCP